MLTASTTVQYVHNSMSLASKPSDISGFVNLNSSKLKPAYHRRKFVPMNSSFEGTARVNETKEKGMIRDNNLSHSSDVNESLCEERVPGRKGDSIMKLTSMATAALAGENQGGKFGINNNYVENGIPVDAFRFGRLLESNLLYRQTYVIRSYEVGVNKTASIGTLMKLLQDTALNHVYSIGLGGDGFGTTPEMRRRNLIWAVSRMQVQVDRYPLWCDVVEIDSWATLSGKNGLRMDWTVRDYKRGHILTRATGTWVMMNSETRSLSKIPEELIEETQPYYLRKPPILADDTKKLCKLDVETAQYIRYNLTPKWSDLDMNQHVNNVKYVGWILESVPAVILKNNELVKVTLEYRRECGATDVLQSLTSCVEGDDVSEINHSRKSTAHTSSELPALHCMHSLQMQPDGTEILRAKTDWRPKTDKDWTCLF
eukprot:Gb_07469 [translate_table: standard]